MDTRRRWAAITLAAAGMLGVGASLVSTVFSDGRTPDADFIRTAFGEKAVVLDEINEGSGSSEDKSRTVVVNTALTAHEVTAKLRETPGWKSLGDTVVREVDELCVVAWEPADYLDGHRSETAVAEATSHRRHSVVLSLLYC